MSLEPPSKEPASPAGPVLPLPPESASVAPPPFPAPPGWEGPPASAWATPTVMRRTAGLALAVAVLSGLYVVLSFVTALLAFPADAAFRSEGELAPVHVVYSLLGLPLIASMIAAYVVTNVWLTRARDNGDLITPHFAHRRSRIWIWLGWFVPIVSFWFPRQVVDDVHRASLGVRDDSHHVATGRLNLWWALWIGSIFLDQLVTRHSFGASATESGIAPGLELAAAVVLAAALVPWLLVVRGLTRIQEAATA